ncbi:polymorphic toxin-type HINT domain-containing protein [Kineosporia mesophila]|nr:polymorphic toxin-type HINT domain-containing protein [Kineosporia mesophila]MCD5353835.1 hypothetical protein [Kineosporia mesophila]
MLYRPNGQISKVSVPAAADLPQETLTTTYYERGHTGGFSGALTGAGSQVYVQDVVYNQFDQVLRKGLGEYGNRVTQSYRFDEPTGRLTKYFALPDNKTYVYNQTYTYTDSGNVTSIKDAPEGGQPSETQCFTYDYRQRLSEAWTPTSLSCTAAPNKAALGGPAPYWRSYTYDAAGNRKSETAHATTDTTRTYTYPASGGAPGSAPHAVTSVASVTGTAAAVTQKYAYDEAGNMTCRPTGATANTCPSTGTKDAAGQALTWTDEGSQSTATDKSGTTSYVYDADGNRLIRRDPTGTTVYLTGGQEVRKPTSGTATATRYYSHDGENVAVRTKAGLNWLLNDHHGTSTAFVAAVGLVATRRRMLPFGEDRGTAPASWPGDKGFLGGTKDNTGLTHLGAREYDPKLGRFVSVDPVMDLTKPDQWNGYSYANDNPVTLADPSGLNPCTSDDGPDCMVGGDGKATSRKEHNKKKKEANGHASTSSNSTGTSSGSSSRGTSHVWWYGPPKAPIDIAPALPVVEKEHHSGFWGTTWKYTKVVAGEVTGFNDAKNCLMEGDVAGCTMTGITLFPPARIVKLGAKGAKAGWKGARFLQKGAKAANAGDEAGAATKGLSKCLNSFAGPTLVLMADGTSKPIKDVEIGDKVLATDPATGESGARTVTAVMVHQDTELTDLSIRDESGKTAVVHTTQEHPFWNAGDRQWTDARDLKAGDQLTPTTGALPEVMQVRVFDGSATMYNLTVADIHTYYVLTGATPVLVHNCGTGNVSDKIMKDHILPRHDADHADAWKWAEKSKFEDWVAPDHIRNWAKLAMRKPMDNMNVGTGSAHRHVLDIKSRYPIGYDADGNDLYSVAVWVRNGAVESVHPY